jgi:hypothetical protein
MSERTRIEQLEQELEGLKGYRDVLNNKVDALLATNRDLRAKVERQAQEREGDKWAVGDLEREITDLRAKVDQLEQERDKLVDLLEDSENRRGRANAVLLRAEAAEAKVERQEAALRELNKIRKAAIDDLDDCCGPAMNPTEWSPCTMHQNVGDALALAALGDNETPKPRMETHPWEVDEGLGDNERPPRPEPYYGEQWCERDGVWH